MRDGPVPLAQDRLAELVEALFTASNGRVNVERAGGRKRIRYLQNDPGTGKTKRKALGLPADDTVFALVEAMILRCRDRVLSTVATPPT